MVQIPPLSTIELSTTRRLEKREGKWVWKIVIQNFIQLLNYQQQNTWKRERESEYEK